MTFIDARSTRRAACTLSVVAVLYRGTLAFSPSRTWEFGTKSLMWVSDLKMRIKLIPLTASLLLSLGSCGQWVRDDLNSPHPQARINAVVRAGEERNTKSVPLLIDLLEDEDDAVRFYAILALEKITEHRFGYEYAQPSWERARAVRRWREWLRDETGTSEDGYSSAADRAGDSGP